MAFIQSHLQVGDTHRQRRNLEFSVFLKDTSTSGLEELEIEPRIRDFYNKQKTKSQLLHGDRGSVLF